MLDGDPKRTMNVHRHGTIGPVHKGDVAVRLIRGDAGIGRDGSKEILTGTGRAELEAGDVFVIETPGGGGYGSVSDG